MNKIVSIRPPRDQYAPTIDALMPSAKGRERELRCSLMLTRDRAGAALSHCCSEAHPILQHVQSLAGRHVFTPLTIAALEALRYELIRLTTCASALETLFGPAGTADGGGADAGV
jgi:hypothetical protein